MADLGMELDADAAAIIGHGGERAGERARHLSEARRQRADAVAVAHPDRDARPLCDAQAGEQPVPSRRVRSGVRAHVRHDLNLRWPILAAAGMRLDPAAQLIGEQLHAVADAEYRQLALQNRLVDTTRPLVVDAVWSAGEDDAFGAEPAQLRERGIGGQQLNSRGWRSSHAELQWLRRPRAWPLRLGAWGG